MAYDTSWLNLLPFGEQGNPLQKIKLSHRYIISVFFFLLESNKKGKDILI